MYSYLASRMLLNPTTANEPRIGVLVAYAEMITRRQQSDNDGPFLQKVGLISSDNEDVNADIIKKDIL
jgi:hypothetical protein